MASARHVAPSRPTATAIGRHQRAWLSLVGALCLIGFVVPALAAAPPAGAVHGDGIFQLDYVAGGAGGAADTSSSTISPTGNTGDDWDAVVGGTSGAFATAFAPDPVGSAEASFYTGGGSKDVRSISTDGQHWSWASTNDVVPDNKDDLEHAFAAAYQPTTGDHAGHVIFYFGADRFGTNGDSELGFWFFKGTVGLGQEPSFTGEHQVGDLLVLVNWGTGKVNSLDVYRWVGGNQPLQHVTLPQGSQPDCSDDTLGNPVCAVVNQTGGGTPPWPYVDRSGATSYAAGALLEGGIDLTTLLGTEDIGCYAGFLASTRSSHSTTAQLKDFAMGSFPVCGLSVDKTGDALSKVGDPVSYTVTITNTGRITLYADDVTDSLVGPLVVNGVVQRPPVERSTCGASLAPGASCTLELTRTVLPTDPDPLPNTVTVAYNSAADLRGAVLSGTHTHTVNLFQPSFTLAKTGDALTKVGDPMAWTLTLANTSSADSPDLQCTVSDPMLGLSVPVRVAAGQVWTATYPYTPAAGDADPLDNTASATCSPVGFPNVLTATATASANLFQPSVELTKTGDAQGKVGDPVTYTVTIRNTSSADSPDLVLDSFADTLVPGVVPPASCSPLPPGGSCTFTYGYTVRAGDPDPLLNTATVHYHPAGFPNDIWDSDDHAVDLFQPSVQLRLASDPLSKAGDPVTYRLTVTNTGSADSPDLELASLDGTPFGDLTSAAAAAGCARLAPAASCTVATTYTVQVSDADPLVATATVVLHPAGYPNDVVAVASASTNLFQPSISLTKSVQSQPALGAPVAWAITVLNAGSPDSPTLACTLSDPLLGLTEPLNLASGQSWSQTYSYVVQPTDPNPLRNTATVTCSPVGFPNVLSATAWAEVVLAPETPTLPPELPPTGGGSESGLAALAAAGVLAAGGALLAITRKRAGA